MFLKAIALGLSAPIAMKMARFATAQSEGAPKRFFLFYMPHGIAPEHYEKIFEPFTQVDQSTTRQKGGAGLGLPVSRRLAHLLGGELVMQSQRGRGSTFTLSLPLQTRLD